jgi:type III pantothenate kinase
VLLTIDIGNTRIKAGVFGGDKLRSSAYMNKIHELDQLTTEKISGAAISSVVPEKINPVINFVWERFSVEPFVITTSSKFNLKINYSTIETLGIDRLCSCEGAYYLFKNSNELSSLPANTYLLTIDFGTATTINLIEPPGIFSGGIIAPGIELMLNSLHNSTAQLPIIEFNDFESIIGHSTKSSIASGVITATLGLVEKTVKYLKDVRKAGKVKIYITGGGFNAINKYLKFDYQYEENIVLIGIKEIYHLNLSAA